MSTSVDRAFWHKITSSTATQLKKWQNGKAIEQGLKFNCISMLFVIPFALTMLRNTQRAILACDSKYYWATRFYEWDTAHVQRRNISCQFSVLLFLTLTVCETPSDCSTTASLHTSYLCNLLWIIWLMFENFMAAKSAWNNLSKNQFNFQANAEPAAVSKDLW